MEPTLTQPPNSNASPLAGTVERCDFTQTTRVSATAMLAITQMHEGFARALTQRLGSFLQADTGITLAAVESILFHEYLDKLPEPSYLASLAVTPLGAQLGFQMDRGIAFSLLDSLLGGLGQGEAPGRPINEVEDAILRDILALFCQELNDPWKQLPLCFAFDKPLSSEGIRKLLPSQERVLVLNFAIQLTEVSGAFSFVVPPMVSGALLRRLSQGEEESASHRHPDTISRMRRLLLECPFGVSLSLCGVPVTASQLLDLAPGDVLTLSHATAQLATVTTAGLPAFRAQVARRGKHRVAQLQMPMEVFCLAEEIGQ